MTTVQEIYRFIDQLAPFSIQQSWDNSGMLVGHWKHPVSRVLMTLDITPEVIYEARQMGAELIVSHHPLLFNPAKQVTDGSTDLVGQRILALADVYDALRQKRVYKPSFSHEEACEVIFRGAGRHFDPQLVALFRLHHERFRTIFDEMAD